MIELRSGTAIRKYGTCIRHPYGIITAKEIYCCGILSRILHIENGIRERVCHVMSCRTMSETGPRADITTFLDFSILVRLAPVTPAGPA